MTITVSMKIDSALLIGAIFYEERTHQGLKQEDVAKAIGLTTSTMSRMERGKSSMSFVQMRALCKIYGISMEMLLSVFEQREAALVRAGFEIVDEEGVDENCRLPVVRITRTEELSKMSVQLVEASLGHSISRGVSRGVWK